MSELAGGAAPATRGRRGPGQGLVVIVVTVAALGLLATRCVPHPLGPARTFGKYEGKAVTTAKSVLSNVATVRLAAHNSSRDRAFGPYLSVLISDAEEAVSGTQGTFDAIEPPDERADKLQQELDQLVSDALDHIRDVRIATRRGELSQLADEAKPLDDDARKLEHFTERHQ